MIPIFYSKSTHACLFCQGTYVRLVNLSAPQFMLTPHK
jgi:hypothetical protein